MSDCKGMKFVGWIPCVAGELFFSKTQVGLGEADRYSYNLVTTSSETTGFKKRDILLTSLVDWQDSKIRQRKNAGLTRVLVRGESSNYTTVSGSVFFILKGKTSKEGFQWLPIPNSKPENELLELLDDVTRFSAEHTVFKKKTDSNSAKEELNDFGYIDIRIEKIKQLSKVHEVKFEINTNGVVFLEYAGLQGFPNRVGVSAASKRTVCRQAFHFLKYSFHKHTHHDHHNESLTNIHRSRCGLCSLETLVRDLKRGMVDAKRGKELSGFKPSGIGEYGKSLIASTASDMSIFESDTCDKHAMFVMPASVVEANADNDSGYDFERQINLFSYLAKSLELQETQESYFRPKSSEHEFFSFFSRFLIIVNILVSPLFIYLNRKSEKVLHHLEEREESSSLYWEHFVNGFEKFCSKFDEGDLTSLVIYVVVVLSISLTFAGLKFNWTRFGFRPYRRFVDWINVKIISSRRGEWGWRFFYFPRIFLMRVKNRLYGDFALSKTALVVQSILALWCSFALVFSGFYFYILPEISNLLSL